MFGFAMRLESDDENIRDLNQTGVRIPSTLKAKIKAAAKANRHSMNAEIVERLERSFEIKETYTEEEVHDLLQFIEDIRGKGILD